MAEVEKPGAGGGPQECNTSAFLVRSIAQEWRKGSVIAVDGGVYLSIITKLLEEAMPPPTSARPFTIENGPFAGLTLPYSSVEGNAGHITSTIIDAHLITHPHLDHISGFVMNTAGLPGTRPKKLAALPNTIHAFKTHIFNEVIWPNLSDENGGAGLVTYLRLVEGGSPAMGDGDGKGYSEVCDGLLVKAWSISHGTCVEKHGRRGSVSSTSTRFGSYDASAQTPRREYQHPHQQSGARRPSLLSQATLPPAGSGSPIPDADRAATCVVDSSAYFIQDRDSRREVLMFGDVEPDSISLSPRNLHIWQEAAPKIAAGTLAAVFIECSYDDSQSNDRLFGHLKPVFVLEEMAILAREVATARRDLKAAESKKRKRTSMTAEDTRRRSTPRHGMTTPSSEIPLSPKSTTARTATTVTRGIDSVTTSQPDTPHIATPTEGLSLGELEPFAAVDLQGQLQGLKVVIIHVKDRLTDGPDRGDLILEQLQEHEEEVGLGCEFIIAKQGQSFYF
ncbi:cAMP phosphodiesterases class-II domain-containing protein [Sarocladium implicatum]|nr:cAMP phosphodiesterases class-II domain-containing protein [Sarocladium implicatum]